MHIGLIGGIGVAATIAYYRRLTAAMAARGKRLELTIAHAEVQDLARNNAADDRAAQAAIYARLIDRLKAAGAECAAITSIGGHFCYAETQALSSLPLVSAVAPLDEHFAAAGLRRVGLLGVEGVLRSRLYGALRRTEAVIPHDIGAVGAAYRETAISGACDEARRAFFFAEGRKLIDAGAEAVILAGTDLGLAFDGRDAGYPVIDALDIHVDLLARIAAGETALTRGEAA
ncbi:MAG: aspartate/glutamate racemase family protein [Pikeienuella sp.]|uniref:aspartate/glutamate racemase family protein n=1 Tax=Pikeienuella sp. TaxID=2831957 RepID=UPI00391C8915